MRVEDQVRIEFCSRPFFWYPMT